MNVNPMAARIIVLGSVIVGLIAWDAWRYRRGLVRFARFPAAYAAPPATEPAPLAHDPIRGDL